MFDKAIATALLNMSMFHENKNLIVQASVVNGPMICMVFILLDRPISTPFFYQGLNSSRLTP